MHCAIRTTMMMTTTTMMMMMMITTTMIKHKCCPSILLIFIKRQHSHTRHWYMILSAVCQSVWHPNLPIISKTYTCTMAYMSDSVSDQSFTTHSSSHYCIGHFRDESFNHLHGYWEPNQDTKTRNTQNNRT